MGQFDRPEMTVLPDSAQVGESGQVAKPQPCFLQPGSLPGEKATTSGQYVLVDGFGKRVGNFEKTVTAGEPFPPARPGLRYMLADATQHSSATGVGGQLVGTPGSKATRSGQYQLIDSSGKGLDMAATVTKGEPFPPTPANGQAWKLVDATGTRRAGEKAEISGQYALVSANGKKVKGKEVTVVKGESFPPTPKKGQAYKLVDATNHASGERAEGQFKPGQTAKTSGQYELITADGMKTGKEVTVVAGESFPPTRSKGQMYRLVDRTNP
jgi:hypothetical protein